MDGRALGGGAQKKEESTASPAGFQRHCNKKAEPAQRRWTSLAIACRR
jgi:hypothetical protein